MGMIREWYPDAKNIGLLYCSNEANSQYQVDTVHVGLSGENIRGHFTGLVADVIIADGQSGDAAAGTDTLLAAEHGDIAAADVILPAPPFLGPVHIRQMRRFSSKFSPAARQKFAGALACVKNF